ncbi:unnamed protein product [Protopolystoma xenopodis]|uniref:Uncharacterized protein n=1 Tax=Protopolystoma xenopodis TaxID=117903 RepID=A0A448WQE0_9PLAT|nr:unnamed protein product [Protopolystoma xenopodis]
MNSTEPEIQANPSSSGGKAQRDDEEAGDAAGNQIRPNPAPPSTSLSARPSIAQHPTNHNQTTNPSGPIASTNISHSPPPRRPSVLATTGGHSRRGTLTQLTQSRKSFSLSRGSLWTGIMGGGRMGQKNIQYENTYRMEAKVDERFSRKQVYKWMI